MGHFNPDDLHQLLKVDLFEAGWDGWDGESYPGQTVRNITMASLHNSLIKKFHNEEQSDVRDNAALTLFLQCNERCLQFGSVNPRSMKEELVIGEMKSIIYDFFNPVFRTEDNKTFREPLLLNLGAIASHFGLGNGSNIGSRETDFYSKYVLSTMSSTNQSLPYLFRHAISNDPLWSGIEVSRSNGRGYDIVSGSRLSFVPKSRQISRTICTEPLLNMLFQKGIAGVLQRRLIEVFGIDLSQQPYKNARLARIGSETGHFGTIDLSSASDTIALSLVRELVPAESMSWLDLTRSPKTTLPGGQEIDLHMISSMGNGFTFPLQTLIFAALAVAAYRVLDVKVQYPFRQTLGNFAVFGDDIIVDSRVYNTVTDCLSTLGFSVNYSKSFNEGFFRESCGSDFYLGHNVRGVYIKTMLHAGDYYSAINRLNRWSANHGILLSGVISYLRKGCRFSGVPYDEADDAGIKVPESLLRTVKRNRTGAIRYFARVNIPRTVRLPSVEADGTIDREVEEKLGRKLPGFSYLPDGLLFCFIAGWIRNGSIGLRTIKPKAVLRERFCPGWDNRILACGESRMFSERWKMFTEANLVS